jgi:four helix bundle protein
VDLKDLEVYQLSRKISKEYWNCFHGMNWQEKRIVGDQCMRSIDSVGANIAEGFGRYYFKDKIRFLYNARGSLIEAMHWIELSCERTLIEKDLYELLIHEMAVLHKKLNNYISSTANQIPKK